jgi:hypothetical protein
MPASAGRRSRESLDTIGVTGPIPLSPTTSRHETAAGDRSRHLATRISWRCLLLTCCSPRDEATRVDTGRARRHSRCRTAVQLCSPVQFGRVRGHGCGSVVGRQREGSTQPAGATKSAFQARHANMEGVGKIPLRQLGTEALRTRPSRHNDWRGPAGGASRPQQSAGQRIPAHAADGLTPITPTSPLCRQVGARG